MIGSARKRNYSGLDSRPPFLLRDLAACGSRPSRSRRSHALLAGARHQQQAHALAAERLHQMLMGRLGPKRAVGGEEAVGFLVAEAGRSSSCRAANRPRPGLGSRPRAQSKGSSCWSKTELKLDRRLMLVRARA